MTRPLVAVTFSSGAKAYAMPLFSAMAHAVYEPHADVRIYGDWNVGGFEQIFVPTPNASTYAEDMLMATRERAFADARAEGRPALVLAGIDALLETPSEFARLLNEAQFLRGAVAPLITARSDANHAICRRFYRAPGGGHLDLLETQHDVPVRELTGGDLIPTGFPGADNLVVSSELFDVPFAEGHTPWYERVAQGRVNLCVEEEWVLRCLRAGHRFACDTSVKAWHVHEDGVARRWRGVEKRMGDLVEMWS